jgi:hypothetical protein
MLTISVLRRERQVPLRDYSHSVASSSATHVLAYTETQNLEKLLCALSSSQAEVYYVSLWMRLPWEAHDILRSWHQTASNGAWLAPPTRVYGVPLSAARNSRCLVAEGICRALVIKRFGRYPRLLWGPRHMRARRGILTALGMLAVCMPRLAVSAAGAEMIWTVLSRAHGRRGIATKCPRAA